LLVHVSGLIGILSPYSDWFLSYTPLNLLITAAILIYDFGKPTKNFIIFLLASYVVGFLAEYLGVNFGILFGDYAYGQTLGPKILGVPWVIGANWFVVMFAAASIANLTRLHVGFKIAVGAALATFLDFFIEPVAMRYDFWDWQNSIVPMSNYVGWFFISALLIALFYALKLEAKSKLPIYVYIIQLGFFMGLFMAVKLT
jgi:putative membrane protein